MTQYKCVAQIVCTQRQCQPLWLSMHLLGNSVPEQQDCHKTYQPQTCNVSKRFPLQVGPGRIPSVQHHRKPARVHSAPRLWDSHPPITMWSPSAFASTLKISSTSPFQRLGLDIGSLATSSLTESSRTFMASGNFANVPGPNTVDQVNNGTRKGLTCWRAPATKQNLPNADFSARPVTPLDAWCFSIHSTINLTFFSEIPFFLLSTWSWYPIHCTDKPPLTFFHDSGNSTNSNTNIQNIIFRQKYSPSAVSQPSSANNRCKSPSSLPPSLWISLTTPAANRCQW